MKPLLELIWELRDALERDDDDRVTELWLELVDLSERRRPPWRRLGLAWSR